MNYSLPRAALLVLMLLFCAGAGAAPQPQRPLELLPRQFAGWEMSGTARTSSDPASADQAYAPVLKEYGFHDFAAATYIQPGRTMSVRAARFNDASGAYGAFTFYKNTGMQTEKIGDLAASDDLRVLFYRGNVLVEAKFDRVTAMSAAELRELASSLPPAPPSADKLPTLPQYLPRSSYIAHSAKYVVGPAGLAAVHAPISAEQVDFGRGAELVLGRYANGDRLATLTLISYPTPQIAVERLRFIEASSKTIAENLFSKRTGPLLVVVSGDVSPSEAKGLLASVNYEADVTWNQNTYLNKKNNVGNLIVAALLLCGILMLIALALGLAFGGVRVLLQRMFPGKVFAREDDVIRLNLPR